MQIGIDLGATKIEYVLLDEKGNELIREREKSPQNYQGTINSIANIVNKLDAKFNGYLDVSREGYKKNKEEFSIDWKGGLLRDKGTLRIKKFPLSAANIFLENPRDFQGGLDINLSYNLDEIFFDSKISSNNLSIKNKEILFDKGLIEFNNSIFDIDFSLFINESKIPIKIKGAIPIKNEEKLYLRFLKFLNKLSLIRNQLICRN